MIINVKKGSFGFRFVLGLVFIVLFLFAYEGGTSSFSYQLTGFSIRDSISEETGFIEAGIVLLITIYFMAIILIELIKFTGPEKEKKSIYDYINE